MLDSQIATTADLSLIQSVVSRPKESVLDYDPLPTPYTTPLCSELQSRYGDMESMTRILRFSMDATSILGEWCANRILSIGLADDEVGKMERQIEKDFMSEKDARPVVVLNAELQRIKDAKELVKNFTIPPLSFEGNSISPKVKRLRDYLDMIFENSGDARCIIFVKQRYTARLLLDLLPRIANTHLRLSVLIGTRASTAADLKLTCRQQVLTLMRFRKGEINCLLATSVAEEGLDIPDCNTVIRFDLYDTLIQYIQSRGRARHKNSRYLHMVERGNRLHLKLLKDVRDAEKSMRKFCEALPSERLLHGNEDDFEGPMLDDKYPIYKEPTTGAKLTYGSSLGILAHFVSCLVSTQHACSTKVFEAYSI